MQQINFRASTRVPPPLDARAAPNETLGPYVDRWVQCNALRQHLQPRCAGELCLNPVASRRKALVGQLREGLLIVIDHLMVLIKGGN